ncbi:MAG TPA: acyl-CoA thioesterase domain-containing protein [Jatrophihabitans sp.]|nr:acyl-CoA thioesterase domain-containing protein [Jatrophihabitans sp.]
MTDTLAEPGHNLLLAELALQRQGPDRLRSAGDNGLNLPHVFGGQVLAQALLAAGSTVADGKVPHSLHTYFLRAGDTDVPIEYDVRQIRDGRRLSCRAVTASQAGREIATVLTSFADTEGSLSHQLDAPDVPDPEQLPEFADAAAAWGGLGQGWQGLQAIEVRVDPHRTVPARRGRAEESVDLVWMRARGAVGSADPLAHAALLVYLSDITLIAAALVPHGVPLGQEEWAGSTWNGMSLDHAIWFSRPPVADRWLLFRQSSPQAHAGRALAQADIFDQDGQLVACTRQEGLIFDRRTG